MLGDLDQRRRQARLTEYAGMPHGFLNFPGLCRGARPALAELIAEQKAALTATDPAQR
jgi:acetyl esterase